MWTQTYTGKRFHPLYIAETRVDIRDISHALSNLCRFAGHVTSFYSVAQHSVIVSKHMEQMGCSHRAQLQGLLHDATEAYLIDLPKPIKRLDCMRDYCDMETALEAVIAKHFGFEELCTQDVKHADMVALSTEARDLMGDPQDWASLTGVIPMSFSIFPLPPKDAKAIFIDRFLELTQLIGATNG